MQNLHHQEISCSGHLLMENHSLSLFSLTERGDYITSCFTVFSLNPYGPEEDFTITITIPADNDALEGTELLMLIVEPFSQFQSISGGNSFFQHTSIQINDTTGN